MVTSGGQQAIDLSIRTFVNPGDTVLAEGPTYPGAVPCFTTYEARVEHIPMDDDGLRVDLVEEALDRLAAEGRPPKLLYTIPNFHNPAGVTMSLERRERLIEIAHERELLIVEDNPYGQIRFDGEPLPTLWELDAGAGLGHLPLHVLEDPRPRHARGLGRGARGGAAEDEPGQAGRRPLHLHGDPALRDRVPAAARLARLRRPPQRHLPPAPRRAAARAGGGDAPEATWTRPTGGLFVWATLPDYIDTTNLAGVRPRAARGGLRARPGGLPRRPRRQLHAPQLLGRPRGDDQRGRPPPRAGRDRDDRAAPGPGRRLREGRGPEGRALPGARGQSLRSGLNAEAALRRLGHDVLEIDVDQHLVRTLRAERPDAAFIALHGKGGEDGTVQELLEILEIPYTGPGVLACERATDKVVAKAHFAAAGDRHAAGVRVQPGRVPGARRRGGDPRHPRAPGPAAGGEAREAGLGARHHASPTSPATSRPP